MPDLNQITRQLTRQEDRRAHPYWDKTGEPAQLVSDAGNLSVGIGRNMSNPFRSSEIDFMLRNDLDDAAGELDRHLPVWRTLSLPRQNVLLNMCFNMGWTRLSGFVNMLAAVREGRHDEVPGHMKDSLWYRKLTDRATELITQWKEDRFL